MRGIGFISECLALLLVISGTSAWALIDEKATRGTGVVATDRETGEQKEFTLYNKRNSELCVAPWQSSGHSNDEVDRTQSRLLL
jgi:hypothetical protein